MARSDSSHPQRDTETQSITHEYIRVRPTTDAIHPQQVTQALTKLHALPTTDDGGLLRSPNPPTVEMLLITSANSQRVDYLFGIDGSTLDALDRVLAVWFPNSYERTRTSTNLQTALTQHSDDTQTTAQLTDRSVAGLELHADERHPGDWRTRLTPFADFHEPEATDPATWPLGSVLTALAQTDTPVVVQTLLQPLPDWSAERNERIYELRTNKGGTIVDKFLDSLDSRPPQERDRSDHEELPPDVQSEIEELQQAKPRRSLAINTRAVATAPDQPHDPATALANLGDAFAAVGHTGYQLTPAYYPTDSQAARQLAADLTERTLRNRKQGSHLLAALPVVGPTFNTQNPQIVAAPDTAGAFCAVGGASLPEPARRAIQTKSRDSVPRPLPPTGVLDHYRTAGFRFGHPQSTNSTTVGDSLAVPPSLQRRHLAILGQTGWGKGMLAITGLLHNHAATDGATIILETKDGQFADDYLRAHYSKYETLDDVYRFDAHERLPAAPIFDIEPAMASGLSRTQAVQAVTNQLEAMLQGVMGTEAYEAATTSSRVIRAIVKALFDPVHGDTRFTLVDLQEMLGRMERTESAPPVASDQLRRTLSDIVANSQDTFTEIIRAAGRRLDELATHEQLAPQFTYIADSPTATVNRFDWRTKLDEDCVIIIDSSTLDSDPQRVLTLLTLSQLWTALRRRRRERREAETNGDPPLVNIHIEEAADVAASGVLDTLLSKGRSFGVGVSLSMQFLKQLDHVDPEAYAEAVNNTGTVIAGQTNRDRALAERLATSDDAPTEIANRLRALDAGEWLCSLPAAFDGGNPAPFTIVSGPLPPGHPDGPEPLSEAREVTFDAATAKLDARTHAYGLPVADGEQTPTTGNTTDNTESPAITSASEPSPNAGRPTLDTTGPFTSVTPEGVEFDTKRNDWCCTTCGNSYGSSLAKLLQAVDCHGDRTDVDRDRIPTLEVDCSLTRAERGQSPYDDAQLVFMQLLYNVRVDSYDHDWEFDIVWDDMDRLVAYAGLVDEQLAELITDGLVVQDTTRPQTIYSLTADGREAINVAHREGVIHGDGKGDLSESNFHVMLVETLTRVLHRQYVNAPDQPGVTVEPYYGVADGRLDVAVLDSDENVIVAGEAERSNNDTLRAVPDDYDKMAACTPDEAIWLVPNRTVGHEVKRALCNPPDGQPRLPDRYADGTRLAHMDYDEPGVTELVSIQSFRDAHLDSDH